MVKVNDWSEKLNIINVGVTNQSRIAPLLVCNWGPNIFYCVYLSLLLFFMCNANHQKYSLNIRQICRTAIMRLLVINTRL